MGAAYGSAGKSEYVQGVVGSDYKPQKICPMRVGIRTGKRFGIAQGTELRAQGAGHRAQGAEHRVQGAEHRAQGAGHRGKNGMRLAAKDEETARPQDCKTARLQDKVICMRCVNIYLLIRINNIYITFSRKIIGNK